jgi:hypothetical protein
MEGTIDGNNEKSKVLLSTVISQKNIYQARTEAIQEEITAKMDFHQERLAAGMNAWQKHMTACRETTKACLESKEPTLLEVESVAVHEEVPKEVAKVEILEH